MFKTNQKEILMAVPEKKTLQTYLTTKEKTDYIKLCEKRKVKASVEIRSFVQSQLKRHKSLLKELS